MKGFRQNLASIAWALIVLVAGAAGWASAATAAAPVAVQSSAPAAPVGVAPPQTPGFDPVAMQRALSALGDEAQTASNDQHLATLEAETTAIEAQARTALAARLGELAANESARRRLPRRGVRASPAERSRAAALAAQRPALEQQADQARAVADAASSIVNLIAERRREGFSARVLERSASPLSPAFWTSLASAVATDFVRLASTMRDATSVALQAPEPKAAAGVVLSLALGLILAFPVRRRLERLGRAKTGEAVHPGFARTAAALWVAAVDVGFPTLGAAVVHLGAQWGGVLSQKADALAGAAVVAIAWASAILALGRVLATDPDASQRLMPLPETAARRLAAPLAAVALVTGAGFFLTRLNYVVGASVAATIAANCVLSLAYAAVAGLILISLGRGRGPAVAPPAETPPPPTPAWTLISLFLTAAIVVTLGAVIGGYTTLAALISSQIFWLSIIAATTYLLLRFVDDLCGLLFSPERAAARALAVMFGLRRSTISQAGLLASAGVQLVILVGAVSLALTPFGQSGDLLLSHFSRFGGAFRVGSAVVSPTAIIAGLATLAVGMGAVHLVQSWINRRYLPLTDWDAGLRNSVSTGVGYLGVGLAVLCAMAAMGFGFQQIALIASALSVGIGFGLQQIVQNFVSGVILLVERPVKVGDWVSVGGVEGDIRRIRVRATEIRTFDRSTVIVPNSDLITKPVQNKMLGEPRSRVQLQLSIANPADADQARRLILETAKGHERILTDPEPAVYIDSLAGGGAVNFNCYLYVRSPREVYGVRSELYFALLAAFAREKVAFVGVAGPQNVVVEAGPDLKHLLTAAASKAAEQAGGSNGRRAKTGAEDQPA